MTRSELTSPLRVGPWWFGMFMIVLFVPVLIVFHVVVPPIRLFVKELYNGLCSCAAEFKEALMIMWDDKK